MPQKVPPQTYNVWVFYADSTEQYYYYASLKPLPPTHLRNIRMHFSVKAYSEHDAIARALMEGYQTRERF